VFKPDVPKGMVIEGEPFLAPEGPFVAFSLVTPKVAKQIQPAFISPPCCVTPVASASGRVVVDDFETGDTVLSRRAPVSSSGAEFAPGDSFVVATADVENVALIPIWSATAPVTVVTTPRPNLYSDAEDFVITTMP
jgi:hypothetical protein